MLELTKADIIWNRACNGGASNPRRGDVALVAMITAHGLALNGGLLHAVETLSASQLSDAMSGYRFFGLDKVADLLSRAYDIYKKQRDFETQEPILDDEYSKLVQEDSWLVDRFEEHLKKNPSDFAPL